MQINHDRNVFLILDSGREVYINEASNENLQSLRITRFSQLSIVLKTKE
jgi:hypothetical protein